MRFGLVPGMQIFFASFHTNGRLINIELIAKGNTVVSGDENDSERKTKKIFKGFIVRVLGGIALHIQLVC